MLEDRKKFTFGLKKTKWMVVNTGRETISEIDILVEEGKVERTEQYKLVGFWLNEKGNCELQITKNVNKVEGKTSAIKTLASYNTVGCEYINVRMKMYCCCILHSLLYALEAWNQLRNIEYDLLEKAQGMVLRRLLDLPQSTPYEGILCEFGIWKIKYVIFYRKIMLFHNIIHSDDRRPIKKVVLSDEVNDTFWDDVRKMIKELKIEGNLKEMKKSALKKEIKRKVEVRMIEELRKSEGKTKLRFVKVGERFVRKNYTKEAGHVVKDTLITKLNMQQVYGNFKGDIMRPIMCPLCSSEEDTTEHLLRCPEGFCTFRDPTRILCEEDNIEQWRLINNAIEKNFQKRKDLGMM